MRCGGCSKQVRKTSIVYVSDGAGGFARKRLGACCAKNAVTLLAGGIESSACKCGKPATTCVGCARDGEKKDTSTALDALAKRLKGLIVAYTRGMPDPNDDGEGFAYEAGRVEGLKQVLGIVESGEL